MFNVAQALLLDRGLTYAKHTAVISAFGRELAKMGVVPIEYHKRFAQSYEIRAAADYRSGPKISEERALQTLNWAKEFIAIGEQILGSVSDEEEPE